MHEISRADLFELLALAASLAMLGLYWAVVKLRVRKDPLYAVHALNRQVRADWVAVVMQNRGYEVLAVQTLRNSVMAASFMASTAVLLIIGALTVSSDLEKISRSWAALSPLGLHASALSGLKLTLLLACLCATFFCFSMAVRFFNHVGYMIMIRQTEVKNSTFLPIATVSTYLNRAGHYYAVGMRLFYCCVPIVFWFFGPVALLLATLGLVYILRAMDRIAPAVDEVL